MAIIGARETIMGLKALGLDTVEVTDPEEVVKALYTLKREKQEVEGENFNKYAIIFVMEDCARAISPEDYKKLTTDPLPAIISLPSHLGSTGFGLAKLKSIVEKAVGMDILN